MKRGLSGCILASLIFFSLPNVAVAFKVDGRLGHGVGDFLRLFPAIISSSPFQITFQVVNKFRFKNLIEDGLVSDNSFGDKAFPIRIFFITVYEEAFLHPSGAAIFYGSTSQSVPPNKNPIRPLKVGLVFSNTDIPDSNANFEPFSRGLSCILNSEENFGVIKRRPKQKHFCFADMDIGSGLRLANASGFSNGFISRSNGLVARLERTTEQYNGPYTYAGCKKGEGRHDPLCKRIIRRYEGGEITRPILLIIIVGIMLSSLMLYLLVGWVVKFWNGPNQENHDNNNAYD